jgi:Aldehyde dehydrogenase family
VRRRAGILGEEGPQVAGRRAETSPLAASAGSQGNQPLRPLRRRRDRPVELSAAQQLRRREPGPDGGKLGCSEAGEHHAAQFAADRRGHARGRRTPTYSLVATGSGIKARRAVVDSVDMLHATGSTRVGKQLMEHPAKRLLPVTLELGGEDPMIVLRDANVERAANAAVWGALQNRGQT